jgi:hypothetical protein
MRDEDNYYPTFIRKKSLLEVSFIIMKIISYTAHLHLNNKFHGDMIYVNILLDNSIISSKINHMIDMEGSELDNEIH